MRNQFCYAYIRRDHPPSIPNKVQTNQCSITKHITVWNVKALLAAISIHGDDEQPDSGKGNCMSDNSGESSNISNNDQQVVIGSIVQEQ